MHSKNYMYNGSPFDVEHPKPELFTVHHNGDYSGDVVINLETWRVEKAFDSPERHGETPTEVKIPFEVLAKLVADYIRDWRIGQLENADWQKILKVRER